MKLTFDERIADKKIRIGSTENIDFGSDWSQGGPVFVQTTVDGIVAVAFDESSANGLIKAKQVYMLMPVETVRRKIMTAPLPPHIMTKREANLWRDTHITGVKKRK